RGNNLSDCIAIITQQRAKVFNLSVRWNTDAGSRTVRSAGFLRVPPDHFAGASSAAASRLSGETAGRGPVNIPLAGRFRKFTVGKYFAAGPSRPGPSYREAAANFRPASRTVGICIFHEAGTWSKET